MKIVSSLKNLNVNVNWPWVFIVLIILVGKAAYAIASTQNAEKENIMKMRITAGTTALTATMYDNATARDFMSLLPITLKITDYASTEKVSDLPKKLSTQGAPAGCKGSKGDITLYAPWGNLAIFYRDFGYASGLVSMGKIDNGINNITNLSGDVLFERID